MSSGDDIDQNLALLAKETADEVEAISQQEQVLEDNVANPDGDPCNSYAWSIIFLLVFVVAIFVMVAHAVTLFRRRASLTCIDILTVALFLATIVQFGPMLSQVLHSGHEVFHFSQTGCKMLFYTDYGMRHVITFIVTSFFMYAYLVVFHRFEPDNLDRRMRDNVAWFIILLAVIECLFGMPAAIYVDVGPNTVASCVWTSTMSLTMERIVALEMIMRPITPYLLPTIVLLYPLFKTSRIVQGMEESKTRSTLHTCLVIAWSYFGLNLLYALLLVAESASYLTGANLAWTTVCNLKWGFFLLHQAFFLLAPCCLVALEVEKGTPPPGANIVISLYHTARKEVTTRVRFS